MKVITEVTSCGNCPHWDDTKSLRIGRTTCGKMSLREQGSKDLKVSFKQIPDWCPVQDKGKKK